MAFFEQGRKWVQNPLAQAGIDALDQFGQSQELGMAGKTAKGLLKQMSGGNYGGLAGSMLSPIHDRYAANLREAMRGNSMGGNAFAQGAQPGLMSGIEMDTRRGMAQDEGLAYGAAIPQLYGQAAGVFQNAQNSRRQAELEALNSSMRARLGAGQFQQTPSAWDKTLGFVNGAAQIASLI